MNLLLSLVLFLPLIFAQYLGVDTHRTVYYTGPHASYTGNTCVTSGSTGTGPGLNILTCTLPAVSAGQTILVNVANDNTFTPTITDSSATSGDISLILGPTTIASTSPDGSSYVFLIKNTNAGDHVLTVTFSGAASFPILDAVSIAGASPTSPIESVNGTGDIFPDTNQACGNVTAGKGDLMVSIATAYGDTTQAAGTIPQNMTQINVSEYGFAPVSGTNHVSWTVTGAHFECDTVILH